MNLLDDWTPWNLDPINNWKFNRDRLWRFPWAWPRERIAIEIGPVAMNINWMLKMNEAARLGWKIFYFTPQMFKDGSAQTYMKAIVHEKETI